LSDKEVLMSRPFDYNTGITCD